jgi:hypothetical protein
MLAHRGWNTKHTGRPVDLNVDAFQMKIKNKLVVVGAQLTVKCELLLQF